MKRFRALATLLSVAFRADPRRAVGVFLVTATESFVRIFFALWLALLIDGALSRDLDKISLAAGAYGGSVLLLAFTNLARINWGTVLNEKAGFLIDQKVLELTAGIPTIEHHERADYQNEIELLRQQKGVLGGAVGIMVQNLQLILMLVAMILLMIRVHPLLTLLTVFAVPSVLAGIRETTIIEKAREQTVEGQRTATHLFELATTPAPGKEVRIFGLGPRLIELQRDLWAGFEKKSTRAGRRAAAVSTFGWLLFSCGYVGALVFVVFQAVRFPQETSVGEVLLAFNLAGQVSGVMQGAFAVVRQLGASLKTVARLIWLEDLSRESAPSGEQVPAPISFSEGIRLENASFTYPGTETTALVNATIHLPAGSTVALVGENGAGKTTLVKLLSKLYLPTEGRITVEGVDLKDIDTIDWRGRISAGFQDFAKLELIAMETVGVGDLPKVQDAGSVTEALRKARAEDVITALPQGLSSQLGRSFENGVELSLGQWQKMALGRAMMRTAPLLLILDEPTASLDAETEHALFERYSAAAQRIASQNGAITLLVSHRFSTVRMADLIVVMEGGRIVDAGDHEALMRRGGLYAELFELQARAYR